MTIANLPNEVNDELEATEAIYAERQCEQPSFEEMDVALNILSFGAFLESHGPQAARELIRNFERQVHEHECREMRELGEQAVEGMRALSALALDDGRALAFAMGGGK